MPRYHLVRTGVLSQIGRFGSVDATRFPRGSRVIARTQRGLEIGEVLSPPIAESHAQPDGSILRGMTVEDELLAARLNSKRQAAYEASRRRLAESGMNVSLIDVEHLFDGQTLVFYFLGPQPGELQGMLADLAAAYDTEAQIGSFSDLLATGCGPGCGTSEAAGRACGNCDTGCAIAGLCAAGVGGATA
ncbi:MAG TPA: PSP1 domain-containing protein [Pirellulales bacterium]